MKNAPAASARLLRAGLLMAACVVMTAFGGCDRLGPTFGLTGRVDQVPPQPIASERLRVVLPESGADATLAPVLRNGDVTVWQTLDGITVSFRRGVLIATRGLGDDLMSSDVEGTLAMLRGANAQTYYPQIRSYLDGEDQTRFRTYQCRRSERAPELAGPGDETRNLRSVTEHCVSPDTEATNTYWLDPAGNVIMSRQWVRPGTGYMQTQYVRQ